MHINKDLVLYKQTGRNKALTTFQRSTEDLEVDNQPLIYSES